MQQTPHEAEPEGLEPSYEPISIGTRGVWIAAGILAATVVAAVLLMAGLLWLLTAGEPVPTVVGAPERPLPLPPGVPAIEADQIGQLEQLRRLESELLSSYTWVDKEAGIARIPIDRAMAIVSAEGLPPTVDSPEDETGALDEAEDDEPSPGSTASIPEGTSSDE